MEIKWNKQIIIGFTFLYLEDFTNWGSLSTFDINPLSI
jgi:hypothetical protein